MTAAAMAGVPAAIPLGVLGDPATCARRTWSTLVFGRSAVQKLFAFASVRVALPLLVGSASHNPPDPPWPPVPPSVPSPAPPPHTDKRRTKPNNKRKTKRLTSPQMLQISARITARDRAVIETVDLLGAVTASQLERLHFTGLSQSARIRRRVMRRLIDARFVMEFRRIGGDEYGTGEGIYALDTAGRWLMRQRQGLSGASGQKRRSLPTLQTLGHTLDISELYVRIVEQSRAHGFTVADFATEPASWWHDEATRAWIKPDAYAALKGDYVDHWWIEVERGGESIKTIMGQLEVYVSFRLAGRGGPSGVIPRVLLTTPTKARCERLRDALGRLDPVAGEFITITPFDDAAPFLAAMVATPSDPPTTPNEKGHD